MLLTKESIEVLRSISKGKKKQYSTETWSILSKLMEPFWNWCGDHLSPNLAPNLITLLSVACIWTVVFALVRGTDTLINGLSPVGCVIAALGVFVFQTLDALDGVQARKTRMCSPIGDFLDHFVDSYCSSGTALLIVSGIRGGSGWILVVGIIAQEWASFMHNWEAKHGAVFVHETFMSITEGQIASILLLLASSVLPPSLWAYRLEIFGVGGAIGVLVGYGAAVVICAPMAIPKFFRVMNKLKSEKKSAVPALVDLTGMLLYSASLLTMEYTSHDSSAGLERILLGIIVGGRVVGQMILARLLEEKLPRFPIVLLPIIAVIVSQVVEAAAPYQAIVLRLMTLGAACELAFYFLQVTREMGAALDIPVWSSFDPKVKTK